MNAEPKQFAQANLRSGQPAETTPRERENATRGMTRNLQLDVLRGIAILLVIGVHLRLKPPTGVMGVFGRIWHDYGAFGVSLFFTLSGYLVGGLLLSELRKRGSISIKRFLIRRGFKIYPAYFVFLLYLILMPAAKATAAGKDPLSVIMENFHDLLPNVFFLQNYVGSNPSPHTWSLAVEEHFYLSLPFFLLLFITSRRVPLLIPFCLLAPVTFTLLRLGCAYLGDPYLEARIQGATHLCLDTLLVGVGIRAMAEFSAERFAAFRPWRYALVLLGVGILVSFRYSSFPAFNGVPAWRILPINACAAAPMLLGALHIRGRDFGVFTRFVLPCARLLGWVGIYSYSIYLWHTTALGFAEREIVTRMPAPDAPLTWAFAALVYIIFIVGIGVTFSKLIEWPAILLRDRYFPSRS
jgi:peptidoglycan/LPS O-acetylase OafA/YrhL